MVKFPKFNMSLVMMYMTYKKVFVVNLKFEFFSTPNLVTLVQNLRNFLKDVPVSKQCTCPGVQNILNFCSQPAHMISRVLAKFRDLQTSFEFHIILKPFYLTVFITFIEPNAKNLASFHAHGLRDVSWT
jgi:hypothetical protein